MRVTKTSSYGGDNKYGDKDLDQRQIDVDLDTLFNALQNRLRFGDGTSGGDGENISGQWVQFTSSATPNAENTISHTIGSIPIGYLVIYQDKSASLFQGPTTGTAWTSSNIYLKSSGSSVNYLVFLIK